MFRSFSCEKFRSTLTAFLLLILLLFGAGMLFSNAPNFPNSFQEAYASARPEDPSPVEKLSAAISGCR